MNLRKLLTTTVFVGAFLCCTNSANACTKQDYGNQIVPVVENMEKNIGKAISAYDEAHYLASFAKNISSISLDCEPYAYGSFETQFEEVRRISNSLERNSNRFINLSGKTINDAKNNLSKDAKEYGFFDMLGFFYQDSINTTELENTKKLIKNDLNLLLTALANIYK